MSQSSWPTYDDGSAHDSFESTLSLERKRQQTKSNQKLKYNRSPFRVDLVAENERIDEENIVRLRDRARQQKAIQRRKVEAKNNIFLKALEEANELDELRTEKREILEEERRLKALIDLEKTNATRKQDRIVAERAERKRRYEKKATRRAHIMDQLQQQHEISIQLLKVKHGSSEQKGTFTSS